MNEPSIIEAGRLAKQGVGAAQSTTKVTLKELIEKSLVDSMTAAVQGQVRQGRTHRGKGRVGNGGHPSLLNLHRDMGHKEVLDTKSERWIDV